MYKSIMFFLHFHALLHASYDFPLSQRTLGSIQEEEIVIPDVIVTDDLIELEVNKNNLDRVRCFLRKQHNELTRYKEQLQKTLLETTDHDVNDFIEAQIHDLQVDRQLFFHRLFELNQSIEMLSCFLENGMDVNGKGIFGYTPLFFVKTKVVADFLVQRGALVNVKSSFNKSTPLFTAKNKEIAAFFIEHGANPTESNCYRYFPFETVCDLETKAYLKEEYDKRSKELL